MGFFPESSGGHTFTREGEVMGKLNLTTSLGDRFKCIVCGVKSPEYNLFTYPNGYGAYYVVCVDHYNEVVARSQLWDALKASARIQRHSFWCKIAFNTGRANHELRKRVEELEYLKSVLEKGRAEYLAMDPIENLCRRANMQLCQWCGAFECGDNTNPNKPEAKP